SGERFTVYATKTAIEAAQMRYTTQDNAAALSWAERGVGYVVTGGTDRTRLTQVARLVYDQAERSGG
ncbi:MAG: anti-sigma factor, partial [Bradyrhizobium sp.]|nr:anti-sigma factor [Bradyrhizobium sp.]